MSASTAHSDIIPCNNLVFNRGSADMFAVGRVLCSFMLLANYYLAFLV